MTAALAIDTIVPASRRMRAGAVACGCALAGAGVAVAVIDPDSPAGWFPSCAFHVATGLWCPGCGLTRATHALLRGDIPAALGLNLFTPLVLVAIVLAWGTWTARSFGRAVRNPIERLPRWFGPSMLVAVVVFGVVRNLPVAPLRALAP